ncbi:SH3 domain-containing protein, partial [bacterium]|nr:SH3 domain-containing protein [bacterium]
APDHVVFKLDKGARIEILEEKLPPGEKVPWYRIQSDTGNGWIRSDFVGKEQGNCSVDLSYLSNKKTVNTLCIDRF